MDNRPRLSSKNVFIVGGITNVPAEEYPDHIFFLGQLANMLRFRYGMNPSFALLDNETFWGKDMSRAEKAIACYRVDQASVDWAGLVIAELSTPSTGTGQELERAAANGTPIIALAKKEIREQMTPEIAVYYTVRKTGQVDEQIIKRGDGNVSLMVEGNPSMAVPMIVYANRGAEGRSDALRRMDGALKTRFGLRPITERIEKALGIDGKMLAALKGKSDGASVKESERLAKEMEKLHKMRDMADSLLVYGQSKYDPKQYEEVFSFIKRLPLVDLERGLSEPTYVGIRPGPIKTKVKP